MSEREQLEAAIVAQERLRGAVSDDVIDATIAALRTRLEVLAGDVPGEKRRKQVTVLFADVSGFSRASEEMDAEDVADSVNRLWRRLDAAIAGFNGRVDKHIGDAVMGLWGSDEAREDDPEQAIRSALAMLDAVRELGDEEEAGFSIRIGINTGPVVLGEMGTTGEYTAMGNTVNIAARLESAAPVGGILINHDTYRHVRGVFSVEVQPPLDVKGISEPLRTYVVSGVRPRAFRLPTRGVEGVETRMIGRDVELNRLQEALNRAIGDNKLQFTVITGDAGIGKSRLLYEFEDWLRVQPHEVRLFKGRADQQRQGVTYGLARDLFYFRFEIADNDPPEVVLAKLEAGVAGFMGRDSREQAHLIGHVIGLDLSDSDVVGGIIDDAKQLHDRFLLAISQLFAAITAEMPAVVLLEDVHWADQASLELLLHLARARRSTPVLIVALARPLLFERAPTWGDQIPRLSRIDLTPLSPTESGQLLAEVLQKVPVIPETMQREIVANVGGNPFYVEEVIKMMIEDGVIIVGEDVWSMEPVGLADLRVPPTLTGVLQARLDRLPSRERDALERASVVGRIFWDAAIPPSAKGGPDDVRPGVNHESPEVLHALHRKELIRPHGDTDFAGAGEYLFQHAILHDVTYEGVLRSLRPGYHGWVARWLAARPEATAYPAMVARHFKLAELPTDAAHWYAEAAQRAQARYDNQEAVTYYQLALQPDTLEASTKVRLYRGLGEVLVRQARYDEALAVLQSMLEAARAEIDVPGQARALNVMSAALTRMGRGTEALATAEQAEKLLRQSPGAFPIELVDVLNRIGGAHLRLGHMEQAQSYGEEALALATEAHYRDGQRRILNLLGARSNGVGRYEAAAHYFGRGLEVSRELGDRMGEGRALLNLGEVARLLGDFELAESTSREALAIQQELGDRDQQALTMSNIGAAYVGMGDYRRAVSQLTAAGGEFTAAGASEHISETYRLLAEAHLGLDETAKALSRAIEALDFAKAAENPEHLGHAWRVLGKLAHRYDGSIDVEWEGATQRFAAAACFSRSLGLFADAGMDASRALALWEWASSELAAGNESAGMEMWHEARELFHRLQSPRYVARMDAELHTRSNPPQ